MAKYNLWMLLVMVLLACSSTMVPARISGRSTDGGAMASRRNEGASAGAAGAAVVLNSYGGCSENKNPHDADSLFCCDKDHECWPSLQVCMPNCPCKVNCVKTNAAGVDPRRRIPAAA